MMDIKMDLRSRFNSLKQNPPSHIKVDLKNLNVNNWSVTLSGPQDTPYYGYKFMLDVVFPSNFPASGPSVKMETPIFHPNIGSTGNICITSLSGWQNADSVNNALNTIYALLKVPNPNSCLNSDAGSLFKNNYQEYFTRARNLAQERAIRV